MRDHPSRKRSISKPVAIFVLLALIVVTAAIRVWLPDDDQGAGWFVLQWGMFLLYIVVAIEVVERAGFFGKARARRRERRARRRTASTEACVGGLFTGSYVDRGAIRPQPLFAVLPLTAGIAAGVVLLVTTDLDGTALGLLPLTFALAALAGRTLLARHRSDS